MRARIRLPEKNHPALRVRRFSNPVLRVLKAKETAPLRLKSSLRGMGQLLIHIQRMRTPTSTQRKAQAELERVLNERDADAVFLATQKFIQAFFPPVVRMFNLTEKSVTRVLRILKSNGNHVIDSNTWRRMKEIEKILRIESKKIGNRYRAFQTATNDFQIESERYRAAGTADQRRMCAKKYLEKIKSSANWMMIRHPH